MPRGYIFMLIKCRRCEYLDGDVFFKLEFLGPTGSFTDRVAQHIESKLKNTSCIVVASDGNLGASIAAYGARHSLRVIVVVPEICDEDKLVLSRMFGAEIVVRGKYMDEASKAAEEIASSNRCMLITESSSIVEEALRGIARDIISWLGKPPDYVFIPAGSGTTISALYKEWSENLPRVGYNSIPRLVAVQVHPFTSIANEIGVSRESSGGKPIAGLAYLESPRLREVVDVIKKSNGWAVVVGAREVYESGIRLAREEGLFVEPAAAAAYAGFLKERYKLRGDVVILLTGSGLKSLEAYAPSIRVAGKSLLKEGIKPRILELLAEHGMLHGYRIWKMLDVHVTPQAIYQHLRELEEQGLVERIVRGDSRRILYRLSNRGLELYKLLLSYQSKSLKS